MIKYYNIWDSINIVKTNMTIYGKQWCVQSYCHLIIYLYIYVQMDNLRKPIMVSTEFHQRNKQNRWRYQFNMSGIYHQRVWNYLRVSEHGGFIQPRNYGDTSSNHVTEICLGTTTNVMFEMICVWACLKMSCKREDSSF